MTPLKRFPASFGLLAAMSLAAGATSVSGQEAAAPAPDIAEEVVNTEAAKVQPSAEPVAAPVPAAEPSPAQAEPEKITDRSHPDYVRCRRERVIGSLAQRRKICMTNREWARIADEGNRRANTLVDEMRANATNNN